VPRRTTRRIGALLVAPDGRTPLTAVMWRCSACREVKPEADFGVTDPTSGRRRAACKPCEAARLRAVRRGRDVRVSAPATVTVRVRPDALSDFAGLSLSQLVGGA
jgi:hypothetical protein